MEARGGASPWLLRALSPDPGGVLCAWGGSQAPPALAWLPCSGHISGLSHPLSSPCALSLLLGFAAGQSPQMSPQPSSCTHSRPLPFAFGCHGLSCLNWILSVCTPPLVARATPLQRRDCAVTPPHLSPPLLSIAGQTPGATCYTGRLSFLPQGPRARRRASGWVGPGGAPTASASLFPV